MKEPTVWIKAWRLLSDHERRVAGVVLSIVILSALFAALMVGSVAPFLSVLAAPDLIHSTPALSWLFTVGGFSSDYNFLVALAVGSIAVILISNLLQALRTWALVRFTTMRAHVISCRLLATYMHQPYEFFLQHHSGSLSTRILAEAQQVVDQFFQPASELIASSCTVFAIVLLLFWIDPTVALASFLILGTLYSVTFYLSRRKMSRLGKSFVEENAKRFHVASEVFGGIKEIKLLGREHSYVSRFSEASLHTKKSATKSKLWLEIPQFVVQTSIFGGMLALSIALTSPESLASGDAVARTLPLLGVFAFAGQRMMPELYRAYRGLNTIKYGEAAVNSVYADLMQSVPEGHLADQAPHRIALQKNLHVDAVSYGYPDAEVAGLKDVNLTIAAGERIGVVGSTGAGKTTLADVILGLLRPGSGSLKVDGTVVTDECVRKWQQSVGYVPQDVFLTDTTIAENIALGLLPSQIDLFRVKVAARDAQLDTFVRTNLPLAYQTIVGERGVRLSGGQRQRIGIARALYRDADLIVFDEATSALDNVTESEVMASIDALPGNKTVLVIAHRLDTVKRCDRIVVMENGSVADVGHWDDLMDRCDIFRKIVKARPHNTVST
ncbi:ABC transporter ATP-binding protein [Aliiruegeria lutimaris]|uniref:ABC-type bacteriocin/lantibiotic exporter, contains an N-terminal double-glycine peptidase domain n=1 Tax=Aliiruegeria lutimaris TaxID=571298 RepID=A0A1G9DSL0_9RHOB|nr:ABC transporter ATP-binding protein [Aliiruegeria lutimaris]SDK66824.1 ABC-type bacteriocin/lantibiotic exporter, contains an N-terminal double-glycine peptidase domain [Aliiruegeria lutimaris]